MIKLAHRGYSAKYPENTMIAFQKAYEEGFDGVETDVQMTKDGQLVLIHDEKINRTSTGIGYVKDYTFQELRQLNFNYKFDGFYEIPTLQELLTFIKGKDFLVNIEIKTDVIEYENIERKVIEMVHDMQLESQILYSSFHLESVIRLKQLDSKAYVGYLMEYNYNKRRKQLDEYHITAFHPRFNYLNQERVTDLKKHHIQIATWTVPTFMEYQRLKELGVDIIISNEYFK